MHAGAQLPGNLASGVRGPSVISNIDNRSPKFEFAGEQRHPNAILIQWNPKSNAKPSQLICPKVPQYILEPWEPNDTDIKLLSHFVKR